MEQAPAAALVLGPLLRYVSATAATVWVEVDRHCTVEVLATRARTFQCHGHVYALVVIEGLAPGTDHAYEVRLDGEVVWPVNGSPFPLPVIRTLSDERPATVVFGSCRRAAPHGTEHSLLPDEDPRGNGVDALRAYGLRMLTEPPSDWPDLMVFLGDQVYADDPSPATRARVERSGAQTPDGVVADFEQYTWLYHESWKRDVERWVLSVVPTAMIFDDHDMIDDWNISQAWVDDIRAEPWWTEHITGGLISYWIYQHLGNLAPKRIEEEAMLAAITSVDDATPHLRAWALASEELTPVPGGYQFSFDRHVGATHLVVLDSRNGRVLEPGKREMIDADEWAWITERAMEPADHVLLATSLPVFAPGGLHALQQWNEVLCDGGRGRGRWLVRPSDWLRRFLDLEQWAAFDSTFRKFEDLVVLLTTPSPLRRPPATVSVLSGDIHFAYVTEVDVPERAFHDTGADTRQAPATVVRQIVCSPLRNVLRRRDALVMRLGSSRGAQRVGRLLLRHARRGRTQLSWRTTSEPVFHNNIGTLRFTGRATELVIEVADFGAAPDDAVLRTAVRATTP